MCNIAHLPLILSSTQNHKTILKIDQISLKTAFTHGKDYYSTNDLQQKEATVTFS